MKQRRVVWVFEDELYWRSGWEAGSDFTRKLGQLLRLNTRRSLLELLDHISTLIVIEVRADFHLFQAAGAIDFQDSIGLSSKHVEVSRSNYNCALCPNMAVWGKKSCNQALSMCSTLATKDVIEDEKFWA